MKFLVTSLALILFSNVNAFAEGGSQTNSPGQRGQPVIGSYPRISEIKSPEEQMKNSLIMDCLVIRDPSKLSAANPAQIGNQYDHAQLVYTRVFNLRLVAEKKVLLTAGQANEKIAEGEQEEEIGVQGLRGKHSITVWSEGPSVSTGLVFHKINANTYYRRSQNFRLEGQKWAPITEAQVDSVCTLRTEP